MRSNFIGENISICFWVLHFSLIDEDVVLAFIYFKTTENFEKKPSQSPFRRYIETDFSTFTYHCSHVNWLDVFMDPTNLILLSLHFQTKQIIWIDDQGWVFKIFYIMCLNLQTMTYSIPIFNTQERAKTSH